MGAPSANPTHARPRHARPRHARPRHARPRHARPRHVCLRQTSPGNVNARHASIVRAPLWRACAKHIGTPAKPDVIRRLTGWPSPHDAHDAAACGGGQAGGRLLQHRPRPRALVTNRSDRAAPAPVAALHRVGPHTQHRTGPYTSQFIIASQIRAAPLTLFGSLAGRCQRRRRRWWRTPPSKRARMATTAPFSRLASTRRSGRAITSTARREAHECPLTNGGVWSHTAGAKVADALLSCCPLHAEAALHNAAARVAVAALQRGCWRRGGRGEGVAERWA